MSKSQREKGKAGERELARFLRETWGVSARRGRQYAGHPDAPDVVAIDGVHIEVKRRNQESIRRWLLEAHRDADGAAIPCVLARPDRGIWTLTLFASDAVRFAELLLEARK